MKRKVVVSVCHPLPSGMSYRNCDTRSLSLWGDSLISEFSRCHITPWANGFCVFLSFIHSCPWSWHWVEREALGKRCWAWRGSAQLGPSASPSEVPWCRKSYLLEVQSLTPALQASVNTKEIKAWLVHCQVTCGCVYVALFPMDITESCKGACFKWHYLAQPFADTVQPCLVMSQWWVCMLWPHMKDPWQQ